MAAASPPFHHRPQQRPMTSTWALRTHLELGALRGSVPCARLHARHVLWEWGLSGLGDDVDSPAQPHALQVCDVGDLRQDVPRPAVVDLVGVEVVDVDLDVRVLRLEALDVLAHVAQADRVDGGHAHRGRFRAAVGVPVGRQPGLDGHADGERAAAFLVRRSPGRVVRLARLETGRVLAGRCTNIERSPEEEIQRQVKVIADSVGIGSRQ